MKCYLVRKWYEEKGSLHEASIGVGSNVEKAKSMVEVGHRLVGEWEITQFGIHSCYDDLGREITINELEMDEIE